MQVGKKHYVYEKKSLQDAVLRPMAPYTIHRSIINRFNYVGPAEEYHAQIGSNEILLGYVNPNFSDGDELVTASYDGKSLVWCIFASRGSGKSVLASNIALDNCAARFNKPIVFIDPQWEFGVRRKPQQNPVLRQTIRKLGFRPRGYNMHVATPKFLSGLGDAGHKYVVDMRDFKRIGEVDRSAMLSAVLELFELDTSSTASPRRQIVQAIMKESECPDTIFELRQKISNIIREKRKSTIPGGPETKRPVSMMALDIIDNLIYPNIIGARKKEEILDVPSILNEYGNFCLQLSMGGAKDNMLCTYLKLAIYQIIYSRLQYMRSASSRKKLDTNPSMLNNGVVFVIDEADKFCPQGYNVPSKFAISDLATKYRKAGVSVIAISQKPQYLFQPFIGEADAIIVGKIQTDDEKNTLRARGVPNHIITNVLQNLRTKVETESGHLVSEWCYIDKNNNAKTFFPAPPCSSMLEEQG